MSSAATIQARPNAASGTTAGPGRAASSSDLGQVRKVSDAAACLLPLLGAAGWRGNLREFAEALPHHAETLDINGLRHVLANLRYASYPERADLRHLDPRALPCLFMPDTGDTMALIGRTDQGYIALDGATAEPVTPHEKMRGTVYVVRPMELPEAESRRSALWLGRVARRMRGLVLQMLGVTLLSSLLSLAVPLFIMAVYDWVIPASSPQTLLYLAAGVLLALAVDGGLRLLRGRILAHVGGRIDMIVGALSFQQILHLPIAMTERSPIGVQLARIRQFEGVRDFFTGPLAGVFLDIPFVVVFLTALALVAGPLVLIPLGLAASFVIAVAALTPAMRRRVAALSEARARRQSFLIETLAHLRTVKLAGLEAEWSQRHREVAAQSAMANFKASRLAALAQGLSQFFMMAAGIATLLLGTLRVLDGTTTVGALVAAMALTWRILSPIQLGFLSLTRLEQLALGMRQINALMRLQPEREPGKLVESRRRFQGEITFDRVSLRYGPKSEPALLGGHFHIAPGEIVAITGGNGAGKSTILKLVAGLYPAQAGAVLIDGVDIRQIDPAEIRRRIAYVPQSVCLFHGTIAQNLRLAEPIASDVDLVEAARDADVLDDILRLPKGFETRLTDNLQRQLPAGFRQRLMLARAYLKRAPIVLLDEPGNHLDGEADAALCRMLEQLRGKATVLVVTHRPSHMRLADRMIHLAAGRILLDGPPGYVLQQLSAT